MTGSVVPTEPAVSEALSVRCRIQPRAVSYLYPSSAVDEHGSTRYCWPPYLPSTSALGDFRLNLKRNSDQSPHQSSVAPTQRT